jgi:hypothetical protein
MDEPAERLMETDVRRPRDLALLLLAIGSGPPRARARDQQADRAGGALRHKVLDRLAAIDPEPDELDQSLASIVLEVGDPTGPTRGICSSIRDEWDQLRISPEAWPWLIHEAVASSGQEGEREPRRRRSRGTP